MELFNETELSSCLDGSKNSIESEVNAKDDDYILNVNEDELVAYLLDSYALESLELDFDNQTLSTYEKQVPAEYHPNSRFVLEPGSSYSRQIIRIYIPYKGDKGMFRMRPRSRIMWSIDVEIAEGALSYEIIDFYSEPESIKQAISQTQQRIVQQMQNVNGEISKYNGEIESVARKAIVARRAKANKKSEMLSALGIPLKNNQNIPKTFSVPTIAKKIKVSYPEVEKTAPKEPEPTLELKYYEQILEVVHDTGKQIERTPSVYEGKHEEDLRDYFLLMLEPRFDGSATGETFNKKGKTDILIRHEGKNLFVAEFKIWTGQKGFEEAIDQLLSYLTWRDSKTAIIIFVRTKDFSATLNKMWESASKHSSFVSKDSEVEETWGKYKFSFPGDEQRKIFVSIMAFHIPE